MSIGPNPTGPLTPDRLDRAPGRSAVARCREAPVDALVLRWVGRGLGIERIEAAWTGSPEGLAILRRVLDSRSG